MSHHLPLSLMNRLNKTESAIFELWILYFQRISFQITYVSLLVTNWPKRNTLVSTNMPKNIRVGRSEILFIFLSTFHMLISGQNCFLGLIFQQNYYKTYK